MMSTCSLTREAGITLAKHLDSLLLGLTAIFGGFVEHVDIGHTSDWLGHLVPVCIAEGNILHLLTDKAANETHIAFNMPEDDFVHKHGSYNTTQCGPIWPWRDLSLLHKWLHTVHRISHLGQLRCNLSQSIQNGPPNPLLPTVDPRHFLGPHNRLPSTN